MGRIGELANSRLDAIRVQHLGLLPYLTGNCAPAAASHQQALALYRQLGDRPAEACVLYYLGGVHRETGDYPAAIAMLWQVGWSPAAPVTTWTKRSPSTL